jgi:hypothetical protein
MHTHKYEEHTIMSEGAPRETLLDHDRLIEGNLIDEHRHKHAKMKHVHPYLHKPSLTALHPGWNHARFSNHPE